MAETTIPETELDLVLIQLQELLKRCDIRLRETTGYHTRYCLIHDIKDIYRQLAIFDRVRSTALAEVEKGRLDSRYAANLLLSRAYCLVGLANSTLGNKDVALQNYQMALN